MDTNKPDDHLLLDKTVLVVDCHTFRLRLTMGTISQKRLASNDIRYIPSPSATNKAAAPALPMAQETRQSCSKALRQQAFANAAAPRLPIEQAVIDKLEQFPSSTRAATACPKSPSLSAQSPLQITIARLVLAVTG